MEKKIELTTKLNEFTATRLFQELSLEETLILWMFAHKKFSDSECTAVRVENALYGSRHFSSRDDPPRPTLFWLNDDAKFRAQGLLAELHRKLAELVDELFK